MWADAIAKIEKTLGTTKTISVFFSITHAYSSAEAPYFTITHEY